MSYLDPLLFGVGLALLVAGAEFLVRGASRLGSSLGVAPLVIGLTFVAWGTSAPELAVNIQSTIQGVPRVALGKFADQPDRAPNLALGGCLFLGILRGIHRIHCVGRDAA